MPDGLLPLLVAIAADALLGDPPSWPHFVRWLGRAISWLEGLARGLFRTPAGLRLAGFLLVLAVVGGGARWAAGWRSAWPGPCSRPWPWCWPRP